MAQPLLRIMLASSRDDEQQLIRGLLGQVAEQTYTVEFLGTYQQAREAIYRRTHDLYLVDYDLGTEQTCGLDLVREVLRNNFSLPIILLTPRSAQGVDTEALQAGASDCLFKEELSADMLGRALRYAVERARILQALRQSEAEAKKLALVAARTDNAVILTDAQGRIEWTNEGFTRITGYRLDEVAGRKPGSFLQGPDTAPETVAHMRSQLREAKGFAVEIINYGKTGRRYWLAIEVQPIYDEQGQLTNFMAIESEITERKEREEILRLRDRAIEAAAEGIVVTDPHLPDNPIIYVNPGFEKLTGYRREDVLGKNCRFLQGEGTDPASLTVLRQAIREERECVVELLNYRRDGSSFWNRLSITPVRDAQGRLAHFVGVQLDMTARKQAEAELAAANRRMKHDLVAAAKVQQALLPTKLPEIPGLRFAWSFQPSEELAGDILNVIRLSDQVAAFYVLDVSGHGVASALMSVAASHLLSGSHDPSSLLYEKDEGTEDFRPVTPAELGNRLTARLPWDPETAQYFTMTYCLIDAGSRRLSYMSAGHPGPIYVPSRGPALILEAPTGGPLGLLVTKHEDRSHSLERGDRIYLYSDGVTDALDRSGEDFGSQRLLTVLDECRGRSLSDSLHEVMRRVESWGCANCPRDDVSLVACEIAPG